MIRPDRARVGELQPWMTAELAKDGGDIKATCAFVFAPTGADRAWPRNRVARPIVNPNYRPWGEDELLDPGWPERADIQKGPLFRAIDRWEAIEEAGPAGPSAESPKAYRAPRRAGIRRRARGF